MLALISENHLQPNTATVRRAVVKDIDAITLLLQNFAAAAVLNYQNWTPRDLAAAKQRLLQLIRTEYLVVAAVGDQLVGVIGAQRETDPWLQDRRRLRELFWWVEPKYRGTRISAQLFAQWQQDVDSYLARGQIDEASLSLQAGVNSVDLGRRGWRCVEQHWIKD